MFLTGLIGYPLTKTLSPRLHNQAFRASNMDGIYLPLSVKSNDLENALKGLKAIGFSGVNITNPYKIRIIELLDRIDARAKKVGAVNTVLINRNRLSGYNTDLYGFAKSLDDYRINLKKKRVLLIGAGGAARAVAYILSRRGPERFFICNRTGYRAKEIIQRFGGELIKFNLFERYLTEFDLVINATSMDMQNRVLRRMKNGAVYYDLNYRFRMKRRKGIKMISGLLMLVYQAGESFRLWTKIEPPIRLMKRKVGVL